MRLRKVSDGWGPPNNVCVGGSWLALSFLDGSLSLSLSLAVQSLKSQSSGFYQMSLRQGVGELEIPGSARNKAVFCRSWYPLQVVMVDCHRNSFAALLPESLLGEMWGTFRPHREL